MTAERLGRAQSAVTAIQRADSRAREERVRRVMSFGIPSGVRRAIGLTIAIGGEMVCLAMVPVALWIRSVWMALAFGAMAILYGGVVLLTVLRDPVLRGLHAFTDRMIESRVRRLYAFLIAKAPYAVEYELHDDRVVARAPVLKSERTDAFSLYATAVRADGLFYLRRRRRRQNRILYFERAEDAGAIATRLAAAGVTIDSEPR